jgi:NTE family protein
MGRSLPKYFVLLFCFSLLVCSGTRAQTGGSVQSPPKQLKIGLVLSGGGARGLAHIGVLKWFEEHRIPVDYLTGTSMGGLVGGMYAMGMSPAEMTAFIKTIDWHEAFASGPAYDDRSYRRKEDLRNYQVAFELGAKNGISLPTGLSSAHNIGLMIDRLTLAYSTVSNFDDLPIPFRCMATDFITAKPLTLKDGSLASALRATMSIPGVFPPVQRDGKVLVDGGLLDNIPTGAMREMKPDVVIAVDIGTHLGDLKSIQTLGGILSQSTTVMTIDNDRRNLRLADVIIAPELGEHTILDFSDIDGVIDLGYQGAVTKAPVLERFSLSPAAWEQHLAEQKAKKRADIPVPAQIQVTGVDERAQSAIRSELQRFVGKPLNKKEIETALTRITGEGRYESLDYQLAQDPSSPDKHVLLIGVKDKSYAPPAINFSVQIDGSDIDDFHFTLGTRVTLYDIGKYGSEWRNDAKIGYRALFASEYLYPLGQKGFFVAPRGYFARGIENFFSNSTGAQAADFQVNRAGANFDLGFLTRRSEFRAGYEIGHLNADIRSGIAPVTSVNGMISQARLRWAFDGTDSATIPSRGLRFSAEGRWVMDAPLSNTEFPQAEVAAIFFQPVSSRGSVFVNGMFGTTFHNDAPAEMTFTLGGPFRLGAYDYQQFRGNHYFLTSLGYRHQIAELSPLLGGKVYGVAWADAGSAFMDFDSRDVKYQGSVGLMMDTKLGPFSLIGALGKGGDGKVYFAFGKFF